MPTKEKNFVWNCEKKCVWEIMRPRWAWLADWNWKNFKIFLVFFFEISIFLKLWQFFKILTIFQNFDNFSKFLQFFKIFYNFSIFFCNFSNFLEFFKILTAILKLTAFSPKTDSILNLKIPKYTSNNPKTHNPIHNNLKLNSNPYSQPHPTLVQQIIQKHPFSLIKSPPKTTTTIHTSPGHKCIASLAQDLFERIFIDKRKVFFSI